MTHFPSSTLLLIRPRPALYPILIFIPPSPVRVAEEKRDRLCLRRHGRDSHDSSSLVLLKYYAAGAVRIRFSVSRPCSFIRSPTQGKQYQTRLGGCLSASAGPEVCGHPPFSAIVEEGDEEFSRYSSTIRWHQS